MTVAPLTATVLASADDRHAGVASGVNNATARAAGLLAVAGLPAAVGLSGNALHVAPSLNRGFHEAMLICSGLMVLAAARVGAAGQQRRAPAVVRGTGGRAGMPDQLRARRAAAGTGTTAAGAARARRATRGLPLSFLSTVVPHGESPRMHWSQMFIPTLREDPADAGAPSHRLLVRGGYIRQLMAGHYSLLPLAVRVRAKVIEIIRQEMNGIGAQEVLLPDMHPAEIWQRSGRWEIMGEEMFRLTDRKGARLVLAMTHEEIFAVLATELNSHKQLPQAWYQFQTKFRDEPRPRAGLLRTREFTMKDSYSFDLDRVGLDAAFDRHYGAYLRIFERLGIPAIPVEASSGTMGGSDSTEFMCPSPSGEDLVVHCPACHYAANIEKATSRLADVADGPGLDTPRAVRHPRRADHRGPGHRLRRARGPADQDARLRAGRPAHPGPAAR